MTKTDLEKLKHLYRERDSLAKKIAAPPKYSRTFIDVVKGSRHEIPYDVVTSKVDATLTYETPEERALGKKYREVHAAVVSLIESVEVWIATLEDPRVRMILRLRYIDLRQWGDVAIEVGYAIGTCKNLEFEFWKSCEKK